MQIVEIKENEKGQRFDRFLRKYLKYTDIALKSIFKAIRKGDIKVNGSKSKESYILNMGDEIVFNSFFSSQIKESQKDKNHKIKNIKKSNIEKLILFEDEYWLAIDKPSGIVIHPGDKNYNTITLVDLLQNYLKSDIGTFKPMFGYRLDKDTSGIIIAGKKYESLKLLNLLIKNRNTKKKYIAVVLGKINKEEIIDNNLEKVYSKKLGKNIVICSSNGQSAKTIVKPIKHKFIEGIGYITLLDIEIKTGRMHQIRVHLKKIKHPVIGDLIYGNSEKNKLFLNKFGINRQLLHSSEYYFYDSIQKKNINIHSPIPQIIKNIF
ncbi:RluA family pseudouridine synthase [Candidatus Vampirococcus lugosii]|uniref:Pseudouridine synthase n=1 Tax=Candidatus Vampirococcus lugosii TaxID=2789015 RepID=A0ABS5QNS0_9BACT|nr:RluA family pseudouridine synthase [Candidatus Vampirococcus lugosii]MBS8122059.1 Ribosomal large subunit pseudouridine synthase C [Candidatus Vampirococcus lugosii]